MNIQTAPLQAEQLTPLRFFTGDTEFSGYVEDFTGKVRRHYHGTIGCSRTGSVLTLDEMLYFNDGMSESRVWTIDASKPQITATATDLVGQATIDPLSADAMEWRYTMQIEIGGKRRPFEFTDMFVQTKDDTMIAKTTMKKFGLPLLRLYSNYRKL